MGQTEDFSEGNTVAVVNDLTVEEQLFLYKTTAQLKRDYYDGKDLSKYKISDPEYAVYLIFIENSTRTKESFTNAAKFHNIKLNYFDSATSSFSKSESFIDTVKMLTGYSRKSMFIIRSTREGVCRALGEYVGDYAKSISLPAPSFINAGDGKHEHPTQEFLDEFTFLEQKDNCNESIHIVLIGDLFHGRTVHSKADGLKIFKNVKVDLIAPTELKMPENYLFRMKENNFKIREFSSIEEYLKQEDLADIWYFTRLQLERMGDEIIGKANLLRNSVTFRQDFLPLLKPGTRFYHPLPRHRKTPVIPSFLDNTEFNGWDEQSINGYFVRIVLMGMMAGKIGEGKKLHASKRIVHTFDSDIDFVKEFEVKRKSAVEDKHKVGIKPVERGIVIDHIGTGLPISEIWNLIDKIRRILNLNCRSSHGVYHSKRGDDQFKGIISLPDIVEIERKSLKKLAAIAPGSSLNIIDGQSVMKKFRLSMPPFIYDFEEISCKNVSCISHPDQNEHVHNFFFRVADDKFRCKFCNKVYEYKDIWDE